MPEAEHTENKVNGCVSGLALGQIDRSGNGERG